jgi:hypothetical protein
MRVLQLLSAKGADAALLDAIADWIDADGSPRANGAEDAYYGQRSATALAAKLLGAGGRDGVGPRRVREAWAALADGVTALPAGAQHQHRTGRRDCRGASASPATNRRVHRRPGAQAVHDDGRAARAPARDVTLPRPLVRFSSSYFLVSVRSRQGDEIAQARALSDGREWPSVVWQTLE